MQYAGKTLLVDPLLADAGTLPPINRTANQRPNPLVPLPVPASPLVTGIDAILVTHTHSDHWDAAAARQLPPASLVFVQPPDVKRLVEPGSRGSPVLTPRRRIPAWPGLGSAIEPTRVRG